MLVYQRVYWYFISQITWFSISPHQVYAGRPWPTAFATGARQPAQAARDPCASQVPSAALRPVYVPGLVNIQKAIENGPVEIVDVPSYKMVIIHGYVNVYQRVMLIWCSIRLQNRTALYQDSVQYVNLMFHPTWYQQWPFNHSHCFVLSMHLSLERAFHHKVRAHLRRFARLPGRWRNGPKMKTL